MHLSFVFAVGYRLITRDPKLYDIGLFCQKNSVLIAMSIKSYHFTQACNSSLQEILLMTFLLKVQKAVDAKMEN